MGKQLDKQLVNMLNSQYLVHKVFKHEGLLGSFLKYPALDRFTGGGELEYLLQQREQPWQFSFSVIIDRPAADFFMMEDVFTGKQYPAFSKPGALVQSYWLQW